MSFESCFHPPVPLDFAWQTLILNSKVYKEYCFKLCGGYIDRLDFESNTYIINRYYQFNSKSRSVENSIRKYQPLYPFNLIENTVIQEFKYLLIIEKSKLPAVVKCIERAVNDTVNDLTIPENVSELINNIYEEIKNEGKLEICEESKDLECFTDKLLDNHYMRKCPSFFRNLLDLKMPSCVLTSFIKRYLLCESDAILIMIEYFKFLTLVHECGDGLTPSPWVDEFWHHHMTFDTKHYRDFCNCFFGGQIDHNECEPPSSDKPELVSIGISSASNTIKCYIEVFDHPPPKCIWPDITNKNTELYPSFVYFNLFKTVYVKFLMKQWNSQNLYSKEKLSNSLEILKGQKQDIMMSIENLQKQLKLLEFDINKCTLKLDKIAELENNNINAQDLADKIFDPSEFEKCDVKQTQTHSLFGNNDSESKHEWRMKYRTLKTQNQSYTNDSTSESDILCNEEQKITEAQNKSADPQLHSVFDKHGLIFADISVYHESLDRRIQSFRDNIELSYNSGFKVGSIEELVDFHSKNYFN